MSRCVECGRDMHPADASESLKCSSCGKRTEDDRVPSASGFSEEKGRPAAYMRARGGSAITFTDDVDNWETPRLRVSTLRHSNYATERVICHDDGTVSYFSVPLMMRCRHVTEIRPGDEPFIRPDHLSRARRHLTTGERA